MTRAHINMAGLWGTIVALALVTLWPRTPQLVVVDTERLSRNYAVEIARRARDGALSDFQIEQQSQQWRTRLGALLEKIAEANGVVIIPGGIGGQDWTDDVEAALWPTRRKP